MESVRRLPNHIYLLWNDTRVFIVDGYPGIFCGWIPRYLLWMDTRVFIAEGSRLPVQWR